MGIDEQGRQLANGGCSSMAERKPSKLDMRVRFPSPAPRGDVVNRPCSSVVEHSLGKGEVASSILAMGTRLLATVCDTVLVARTMFFGGFHLSI